MRHPWPQVHARAESVAARILDEPQLGAVGLVGEPTADFVAAVQGAWLAGQSVSILPGPVRGADPQNWAQATLTRFAGLDVRTVFSHGAELDLLAGQDGPPAVLDLGAAARREPSASLTPVEGGRRTRRAAGHRGIHRHPTHRATVARGGAEQREWPDHHFRC